MQACLVVLGMFGCVAGFVMAAAMYLGVNAITNPTDSPTAGMHVDANENVLIVVIVIVVIVGALHEIHVYKESVRKANEERERKRNGR